MDPGDLFAVVLLDDSKDNAGVHTVFPTVCSALMLQSIYRVLLEDVVISLLMALYLLSETDVSRFIEPSVSFLGGCLVLQEHSVSLHPLVLLGGHFHVA